MRECLERRRVLHGCSTAIGAAHTGWIAASSALETGQVCGRWGRESLVPPYPVLSTTSDGQAHMMTWRETDEREYEASRSAQQIDCENQATSRLVLGWCSKSVRLTRIEIVASGVKRCAPMPCHDTSQKRKPALLTIPGASSDGNVFRSRIHRRAALAAVTPPPRCSPDLAAMGRWATCTYNASRRTLNRPVPHN
jgi:hypothetical protein